MQRCKTQAAERTGTLFPPPESTSKYKGSLPGPLVPRSPVEQNLYRPFMAAVLIEPSLLSPYLQQTAPPASFPSIPTEDAKMPCPISAQVSSSRLSSLALLQEGAAFIHNLALSLSFHSFSLLPLLREVLLSKYPCQLFSTCSDVISCNDFPQSDLISCG